MQPSKKFAFDVGITFLASVVSLPLGFVITIALGRYLGAGDLGLYRMTATIYGIAMLFVGLAIGVNVVLTWMSVGFGLLSEVNNAVMAMVLAAIGIQLIFTAIFLSVLLLEKGETESRDVIT